ncbi:hypothetical protein Dimus_029057, partial [Dionaea muscipula]
MQREKKTLKAPVDLKVELKSTLERGKENVIHAIRLHDTTQKLSFESKGSDKTLELVK